MYSAVGMYAFFFPCKFSKEAVSFLSKFSTVAFSILHKGTNAFHDKWWATANSNSNTELVNFTSVGGKGLQRALSSHKTLGKPQRFS